MILLKDWDEEDLDVDLDQSRVKRRQRVKENTRQLDLFKDIPRYWVDTNRRMTALPDLKKDHLLNIITYLKRTKQTGWYMTGPILEDLIVEAYRRGIVPLE